ncbi:hypothetical protein ScalyP_jg7006 [Parmales sp. scaly parma]|nr:hypothetical protein ScalyP_jg7006 [Parmales sp. scaly parma]
MKRSSPAESNFRRRPFPSQFGPSQFLEILAPALQANDDSSTGSVSASAVELSEMSYESYDSYAESATPYSSISPRTSSSPSRQDPNALKSLSPSQSPPSSRPSTPPQALSDWSTCDSFQDQKNVRKVTDLIEYNDNNNSNFEASLQRVSVELHELVDSSIERVRLLVAKDIEAAARIQNQVIEALVLQQQSFVELELKDDSVKTQLRKMKAYLTELLE